VPKVAFLGSPTSHGAPVITGPLPTPHVACDCGVMAKATDMVAGHYHGLVWVPPNPFPAGSLVAAIEGLGVLRVGDTAG